MSYFASKRGELLGYEAIKKKPKPSKVGGSTVLLDNLKSAAKYTLVNLAQKSKAEEDHSDSSCRWSFAVRCTASCQWR
jgi:hypothetical protein